MLKSELLLCGSAHIKKAVFITLCYWRPECVAEMISGQGPIIGKDKQSSSIRKNNAPL
jgi:hypothetical protein